jgi:hypothetical protein
MATGKRLKAAIMARRAATGARKKRARPQPPQYTMADLGRARDRVAAAERRIDNDRTSNPSRGRAGLRRAQLELSVIEAQLRCAASFELERQESQSGPHPLRTGAARTRQSAAGDEQAIKGMGAPLLQKIGPRCIKASRGP